MFIPRHYLPTSGEESADPRPIEDFFAAHVVVVLGDPGQGKTEAFKQAATTEPHAEFVPLWKFLHLNVERWRGKVLYLDGLDEQRAKLKDRNVLAEIVGRLDQLGCPKVRLSCRTPDWHGRSDLSIMAEVAQGDIVRQLMLLPLADGDVRLIVREAGLDPETFMEEAEDRGIAPLFGNPQLLELFIETAGGGKGWPATRKELMEIAIARMMEEANDDHEVTAVERTIDVGRISEAADRMAALILLSGLEGIALGRAGREEGYIDLSASAGDWTEAIQIAGRRRAFRADGPEQATPRHRTLAEFMAARHLARLIRNEGLPLRRVLTLVTGSDGGTLSDLRGLYAWLITFLPEHAVNLLQRDPLGAIHYGDTASWPVPVRRQALIALQERERIDPYYRSRLWSRPPLAGLAHPDLAEEFRSVLTSPDGTTLGIVLDALAHGTPVPALGDDLMGIIRDPSRRIHTREAAVTAFAHVDPGRCHELVTVLDDLNAGLLTDDRHQLRQKLIELLYPSVLSAPELVQYLSPRGGEGGGDGNGDDDGYAYEDFGFHIGHLVVDATADADLPGLADALGDPRLPPKRRQANWWHYLLTAMYRRMIGSGAFDCDPARLDRWLRLSEDEYGHASLDHDARILIRDFFAARPDRFAALFLAWLRDAPTDPGKWRLAWWSFRERTAAVPLTSGFGHSVLQCLAADIDGQHADLLFELAADALMEADQPATGRPLDILFNFVADHPRFEAALAEKLFCTVPDWRVKQACGRRERSEKRQNWRDAMREQLSQEAEAIRAGQHLPRLDYFARLWFGYFSDVDQDATPRERLVAEIGEELTDLVIEGFLAVQRRNELPDLAEHLRLEGDGKRHWTAYPLLASIDHVCGVSSDWVVRIPDPVLYSALSAHFIVDHGKDRTWPATVIDQRPDIALPVLSAMWRDRLDRGRWPDGLYKLNESNSPLARALRYHALDLLAYRPDADTEVLRPLLRVCAEDQPENLRSLAYSVLNRTPPLGDAAAVTWAAEMAKLDPDTFGPIMERHATSSQDGWWGLRFAAAGTSFEHWPLPLQAKALLWLLSELAPVPTTIGVRSVGRNDPEEASRALGSLIDHLSRRKESEVGDVLTALRDNPACAAWQKSLAHAACIQAQTRRDAEFGYATLEQVADVLTNGPPADIRDLQALVLDILDDLAESLTKGDSDGWRQFWNTKDGKTITPKWEGDGRDYLMELLKPRLAPKSITIAREGDFAAHKRADLMAYHRLDKLPIEIKRNFHNDVWNAMDWQLAGQYATDPACRGYGIYLVLWFDPVKGYSIPTPPDGLPKPSNPQGMESTLRLLADRVGLGSSIAIRVIHCGTSGG